VLLFSPIAVVLGIVALVKISKNKETLKGQGLAIAGISLGAIGIILLPIVAMLAAIAIPNFLRAKVSAQEAAAAAGLHTITAAEIQYRATNPTYAYLSRLDDGDLPYIDSELASGTKHGYKFSVDVVSEEMFYATAEPQSSSMAHSFYIDEDGILCRSDAVNRPVPTSHTDIGCPTDFSELY